MGLIDELGTYDVSGLIGHLQLFCQFRSSLCDLDGMA